MGSVLFVRKLGQYQSLEKRNSNIAVPLFVMYNENEQTILNSYQYEKSFSDNSVTYAIQQLKKRDLEKENKINFK